VTLAVTASILREAGFQVHIVDAPSQGLDFRGLEKVLGELRPGLVAVSTSTPSIEGDLRIAGLAREVDREIRTAFFGIHVTALPEEVFVKNPRVEFVVRGEPEYTIRDLALALRDQSPLENIPGLIHRSNGRVIYNPERSFIQNLDELPFPAWDLVDTGDYRLPITRRPFLLVITGRGCPYPCTYCTAHTFYGKKTRLRSPERIVSEMVYVTEEYGVNDFLFWSENAVTGGRHMFETARAIIREAPGVRWVCNSRVDAVDEEMLTTMKKAGCWMIGYGIEAGSQKVLDLMMKNINVADMERAVEMTRKAGIGITAHVMVGYPGETREDILETAKLIRRLDPDYLQVYCCVPFPGSPLYEELKSSGEMREGDWSMFEQNISVIDTPQLSSREVMALREKMIRDFYLSPRRMVRTLGRVRSLSGALSLLSSTRRFLSTWAGGGEP
jgi:radical SAM superfamily enzyme YgiQ (UPF0313 family)